MNLYISDLHMGHVNALSFDNRPFSSIEEMAEYMIMRWNGKVSDDDHVYILGDIFYRNSKAPQKFLMNLKGHKHLIVGNHDFKIILKDQAVLECFESVDHLKRIDDNGRTVILCHYPILVWDKKHYGSYHVYGHVHGSVNEDTRYMLKQERAFNAGCMINHYEPCTLEELMENKLEFMESLTDII